MSGPIETKTAAGSATVILSGIVVWALTTYIPAWHSGIPATIQSLIPVVVAAVLGGYAAWKAPHTHRPDLDISVSKTPAKG